MSKQNQLWMDAFTAFDEGRFADAEAIFRDYVEESRETLADGLFGGWYMIAFVKAEQKDFPEARRIYGDLLDAARSRRWRKDWAMQAILLHQMAVTERKAVEYDAAEALLAEELALRHAHRPKDDTGFSANYYEQGYVAFLRGDFARGKPLLMTALEYARQAKSPMSEGCALRGLGEITAAEGGIAEAKSHFADSAEAFREAADERGAIEVEEKAARLA